MDPYEGVRHYFHLGSSWVHPEFTVVDVVVYSPRLRLPGPRPTTCGCTFLLRGPLFRMFRTFRALRPVDLPGAPCEDLVCKTGVGYRGREVSTPSLIIKGRGPHTSHSVAGALCVSVEGVETRSPFTVKESFCGGPKILVFQGRQSPRASVGYRREVSLIGPQRGTSMEHQ